MRRRSRFVVAAFVVLASTDAATAVTPTAGEIYEARRWLAAKLGVRSPTTSTRPPAGLYVRANNDPVQIDSRSGRPLEIAGTGFRSGLSTQPGSVVIVYEKTSEPDDSEPGDE